MHTAEDKRNCSHWKLIMDNADTAEKSGDEAKAVEEEKYGKNYYIRHYLDWLRQWIFKLSL